MLMLLFAILIELDEQSRPHTNTTELCVGSYAAMWFHAVLLILPTNITLEHSIIWNPHFGYCLFAIVEQFNIVLAQFPNILPFIILLISILSCERAHFLELAYSFCTAFQNRTFLATVISFNMLHNHTYDNNNNKYPEIRSMWYFICY